MNKTTIDPEAADTRSATDRRMRPRGWTITRRLWAGFGFLILVLVFAAGSSYWQLGKTEVRLTRMIEVERGLKAGFHRYLTKPIRIHEITAALESALEAA